VPTSSWTEESAGGGFCYPAPWTAPLPGALTDWFERFESVYAALWWVPAGHLPSVEEAKARLAHLVEHGPTRFAFTFKVTFPPDDAQQPTAGVGSAMERRRA